jgi:glutaredoxin-dependent peroxiredoxin
MSQLQVGQTAPDFTLFNQNKEEVKLSDFRGQTVVLLFFPLAFTSTCTAELCSMRDDLHYYSDVNAKVLGISVDTVFSLAKFKEEQNFNFDLLSDFNKSVSENYGTLYDTFILGMQGVSKRSAFVVDKEGVLQYVEVLEKASDIPNLQAIQSLVKTL